jgi:hypothetical protein
MQREMRQVGGLVSHCVVVQMEMKTVVSLEVVCRNCSGLARLTSTAETAPTIHGGARTTSPETRRQSAKIM